MKQTVVIGISSGIAAYKMLDLMKSLHSKNIEVKVVLTEHASKMISPLEIEDVNGNKPLISLYGENFEYKQVLQEKSVDHIDMADSADVFIVAPATANTLAKLAHGIADDVLTTTALAVTAPSILCPSMNVNMWNNPSVQHNIRILKSRGWIVIEPDEGPLACGYIGKGRLPALEIIETEILKQLARTKKLSGKHVLVTAGGTVEPIDDVRSITNNSSGKMGIAIAEAAYLAGASVTLLHAKNSVLPRYQMQMDCFETAKDLEEKIHHLVQETDIMFHVAAVADFTPQKSAGKLDSSTAHALHLQPQKKILDQIKKLNPRVTLIAFKAESRMSEEDLIKKARARLDESNADAIVANDISTADRGFQADRNEVIVVMKDKDPFKIPLTSKNRVAETLLEYLF